MSVENLVNKCLFNIDSRWLSDLIQRLLAGSSLSFHRVQPTRQCSLVGLLELLSLIHIYSDNDNELREILRQ